MHLLAVLVLILCDSSSLGFPVPVDTVIVQVQQWGVVGTQQVVEQVLLNGVSFRGKSQYIDSIIQNTSAGALLPTLIHVNQTSVLSNHTVLHSCECILEGSELLWTERVLYDGKVYLTLDRAGVWTAHVPEAQAFKVLWDRDEQRTETERAHLQEGCAELMRELMLSKEQPVPGIPFPHFLIQILALLGFIGLVIISLLLFKNQGLRHPGGVIGSIIHYPQDMTETAVDIKGSSYRTL